MSKIPDPLHNDKLHAGEDWRKEIDQAIKNAFALIVIMTPEAKTSEYVTYEWAFAWGAGVKVIPIVLKHTSLHPRLEALQYLDFSNRTARPWDKLTDVVKNAVTVHKPFVDNSSQDIPLYIKQAITALDSASSKDRRGAIETLLQTNHPTAHEALTKALQHPLRDVRVYTAIGLPNDSRAIPGLLEALHDKNVDTRRKAIQILGESGSAIAIPSLLEALLDENENIYQKASQALVKFGDAAISGLLNFLIHNDEKVRLRAIDTLENFGNPAIPGLLKALREKIVIVRQKVAQTLGEIGDAAAIPGLVEALHDEDEEVRIKAVETLREINGINLIPILSKTLHDKDEDVRRTAAKMLRRIGTKEALNALKEGRK